MKNETYLLIFLALFIVAFLTWFIRDCFKRAELVPDELDPQNEDVKKLQLFIFKDDMDEPVYYIGTDEFMQFQHHEAQELCRQNPLWKCKELTAHGWINAKEMF